MRYPGRGIAFTIPVSGIGRRWHSLLTQADEQEEIRMNKSEQTGFDVVAVVMERGYTNVAMDAARKAGARGGTVISARGIAENEVKRFFGIEIQAEKEIVFLVVKSAEKQQVMTELMRAGGNPDAQSRTDTVHAGLRRDRSGRLKKKHPGEGQKCLSLSLFHSLVHSVPLFFHRLSPKKKIKVQKIVQ